MKNTFKKAFMVFTTLLLLIGCSTSNETKQRTADDYKNAAKHMDRSWYGLVQNQVLSQDWTGDDILTYAKRTATGKEFVSVHTVTKEKKTAFDH